MPAFSTPAPTDSAAADTSEDEASDADSSAETGPSRVGEITVAGNIRTDTDRIRRAFGVVPGAHYDKEGLRRGIRSLVALGLFRDVWLEEVVKGDAADLVIHVQERPRISRITFSGNRKRESSELEKKLSLRPGDILTNSALQTQVDSLMRYFHDEGFARAQVKAVIDTSATSPEAAVRFDIVEGEKVRITRIEFEGARAFTAKRLRKALKTKPHGFFGGGEVKDETFAEDREKLESFYHDHGHRDARVEDVRLDPGAKPRDLTMVVRIDEGPLYRVGTVTWTGGQIVDAGTLKRMPQPKPGDAYDAGRIEKAREAAFGEYAERGYLYVSIDPRETVRDSTVDLAFTIAEGRPSLVRFVNVEGNRNTREKVIRREMAIHEGDRFRRSALVRTQGDIFRLGIFEDVQIDFAPAESTDVDINLKVKEKQVGTASAGAGYTAESGVTGFLELSHNNVLGNGQSLALHLERGGKREDYNLSFTEPWFRDTPTLLGFSLFDTRIEQDVFEEKQVGGSVRLGRPLPWPDYSRGTMAYRLENVTIEGVPSTIEESLAFQDQPIGKPVLTSSVETSFSRNSTDNPFYPTHGTRLDLSDEFAGGPFGGRVDFHKHRYEGRLYLPSIVKGVTTMVRGRVGLLGGYEGQGGDVPSYEKFRLGGGSTLDPLRGYDDYQVVPGKYDRYVPVVAVVTVYDTSGTGTITSHTQNDTTGSQRVRYPGGHYMTLYTVEQQFPIVHPLHGVLFFDAGNTWDLWKEVKPFQLKMGAGIGFRMEIPLLGNVGLDYGYGFNRDDGPRAKAHFLLGNVSF